ncbi:gluconate 2-dehydrogenase subunit 3 family protein [Asaia platycodi]|uniref:gluconate 2-dehydrogenase subunit 3 family protein n=1 Tax=Asaia platycodi TaxID=610243 RepID=UPI000472C1BD|nr:gluconate 2-dehydrogenase subunit 3 family protein [Asaia platycodi]
MSQTSLPPAIDPDYLALLDSDRISGRTRQVMEERAQTSDAGYMPRHLSQQAYNVLGALAARVLPQAAILPDATVNIAARIDARLGSAGDGWRFATLPPDLEAYERALTGLDAQAKQRHGVCFAELTVALQNDLVHDMAEGALTVETLDATQMRAWFADLRADCVQIFISHPAVQAQLGIDAIFNGGDGLFQGFSAMGEGVSESWEPAVKERGQ